MDRLILWVQIFIVLIILLTAYAVIRRPGEPQCIVGAFVVKSQFGLVYIGDQELCGNNLQFGPVKGPGKLEHLLDYD